MVSSEGGGAFFRRGRDTCQVRRGWAWGSGGETWQSNHMGEIIDFRNMRMSVFQLLNKKVPIVAYIENQ